MQLEGDTRRRTVLFLGAGVLLIFAFLGALQAFNPPNLRILNPETSGETLAFTGMENLTGGTVTAVNEALVRVAAEDGVRPNGRASPRLPQRPRSSARSQSADRP